MWLPCFHKRIRRSVVLSSSALSIGCILLYLFWPVLNETNHHSQSVSRTPSKRRNRNQYEYVDKRGMHVVVGHYIGENQPVNLSLAELNTNSFNPRRGAGERGEPVTLAPQQLARKHRFYRVNEFNLLASDMIALNRSLPDIRRPGCVNQIIDVKSLPTCSIIIVFHNEAWSTLLRTVHSAINRSPASLLHEIILVDDASERSFLGRPLDAAVSELTVPVRVLRVSQRTGLVRARLTGAQEATGDVLVFLDAHCECTIGWLEPLLQRIAEKHTAVVSPVIDIIDDNTFAYVRSLDLHWGAFNWQLHFRWFALGEAEIQKRRRDMNAPFRTPAMAGGLFAINRDFFYQSGSYDRDMDIWGGENIEMSLRIWMCGGSVEIHPCSHVGHVFRKNSPYTFPRAGGVGGVLYHNLARVAALWLDEWGEFYFRNNREAALLRDKLDLGHRVRVRKRMKCNSFQWYLENVWPENFFPAESGLFGQISNVAVGMCLQRPAATARGPPAGPATMTSCSTTWYTPQLFVFTKDGFIMTDESLCLDVIESMVNASVRLHGCSQMSRQKWHFHPASQQIKHINTKLCLATPTGNVAAGDSLIVSECDSAAANRRWRIIEQTWK